MSDFSLSKEAREVFRANQFQKDVNFQYSKKTKQFDLRKKLLKRKRYKVEDSEDSEDSDNNSALEVCFI
jgi:hypothetical protein